MTFTVNEIQKSVETILANRAKVDTTGMNLETGAALNTSQARFYLITTLLADTAKANKISITPAELAAAKTAAIKSIGGEANLPKTLVGAGIDLKNLDRYFSAVIYSQKLGTVATAAGKTITELISVEADLEKVFVNPRYGSWDSKTASIIAADPTAGAVKPAK